VSANGVSVGTFTSAGFVGNVTGNLTGNVTGNASTVTNGVYTVGDQTIAGVKTFSSSPIVPTPTLGDNSFKAASTAFVGAQITDYAPSKIGTNASGTWGISITGNAATVGGFTPVQQGGGGGQGTNKVYIGWLGSSLGVQVDSTDFAATWPISVTGNAGSATTATTATTVSDGAITPAKLNGAQSGSAPIYGARAWVNFNGTGTPAIRSSGNVSSITDNGTGDYTINFATAMQDANYSVVGTCSSLISNRLTNVQHNEGDTYSTSAVRLYAKWEQGSGGGAEDPQIFNVAVFR
jgi:hypothetical protein